MVDTHQPPPAAPAPRKRCIVYVDGFNLYYGVLEPNPGWKGFNFQSFFDALRPDEEITSIKYFTALVEPDRHFAGLARKSPVSWMSLR